MGIRRARLRYTSEIRFTDSNGLDHFAQLLNHSLLLDCLRGNHNNNRRCRFQLTRIASHRTTSTIPASQKAYSSSASSTLLHVLAHNPRVSNQATATAHRNAGRRKPSPLRWTKPCKPIPAPVTIRYCHAKAPLEILALEDRQLLRLVSSACSWSCRRRYSNT
jgi:hypothetical protein